jgi:HEAT repeat protein
MPWKKILVALPLAVCLGLTVGLPAPAADEPRDPDEDTLKAAKVATTTADLAAFLRKQTLPDKERQQVEGLIKQLGAEQFAEREEASDRLINLGVAAVPFLREATRSSNLEVNHRAQQCLNEIGPAPDPAVLAAAVRLLSRKPPEDGVALLLEFFPFCGEEWLEEEVMTALIAVGIKSGKPDPAILTALKNTLPARRAAATCVLARRGEMEHRAAVRDMLADPDFKVRTAAARGLLGDRFQRMDVPLSPEDRKIVKTGNVNPDAAGLIAFFRARTLSDEARKQLEQYVEDLDSNVFLTRKEAAKKLVEASTPALPFIAAALAKKNSLEMTRRLEECKAEIEKGPGPALPMAAARLLMRRNPPEAVPVLLAYAPFADDAAVEEEVLNCLAQLAVQDPKVPEALAKGLTDPLPARRGVAALALSLVGDKANVTAVKPLLSDDEPRVRLRAAQGLLAAREREAVPVLVALLEDSPMPIAAQAESLLQSIGGEKAPAESINDGTPDGRKKGHEAWASWWRDHGDKLDLADGPQGTAFLNLTLIAELTSNNGTGGNRVYEFGADGKPRWEIKDLQFPIDAHWLRGDHVLVAEYNAQRVLERDRSGKTVWEKKVPNGNPVACSRLANGNTLIATYTNVMEVTPAGKEVYNHQVSALVNNQQIYNAVKLRNGNIACTTGGTLLIIDPAGKKVKEYMLGNNNFNWSGVEELPGGRFLVAMMGNGKVMEVSPDGKEIWSAQVQGCCHAVRLPNGNTLVACMQQQKIVEVNRAGKVVAEKTTAGRPFHVRKR